MIILLPTIKDFQAAYNIVKNHFPDETIDYRESFKAFYMNVAGHMLGCLTVSEGGPCSTAVDVKLILQVSPSLLMFIFI